LVSSNFPQQQQILPEALGVGQPETKAAHHPQDQKPQGIMVIPMGLFVGQGGPLF
jgi:hypothetical protein